MWYAITAALGALVVFVIQIAFVEYRKRRLRVATDSVIDLAKLASKQLGDEKMKRILREISDEIQRVDARTLFKETPTETIERIFHTQKKDPK